MLKTYTEALDEARNTSMALKLGLVRLREDETSADGAVRSPDSALVGELLELLTAVETDMTIFYRSLAEVPTEAPAEPPTEPAALAPLKHAFYEPDGVNADHRARLHAWLRRYAVRVREDGTPDAERKRGMNLVNPKYLLRNYVAQMAIDRAEAGDPSLVSELLEVLRHPFDEQVTKQQFAQKRPDWARDRPGCSMLSCSS